MRYSGAVGVKESALGRVAGHLHCSVGARLALQVLAVAQGLAGGIIALCHRFLQACQPYSSGRFRGGRERIRHQFTPARELRRGARFGGRRSLYRQIQCSRVSLLNQVALDGVLAALEERRQHALAESVEAGRSAPHGISHQPSSTAFHGVLCAVP